MTHYYIGLMSGTSIDAVDAVLVNFQDKKVELKATHTEAIPPVIQQGLTQLTQVSWDEIDRLGKLDKQVGELFATTALNLLCKANLPRTAVRAIGSHGQNVRHSPHPPYPYTLQIGDPNTIAKKTGIITVADFRRGDIALGGQGAPLVPAFHAFLADKQKNCVGINIGGIANVTLLPSAASETMLGFDTGPGNTLLDAWSNKYQNQAFDDKGRWARTGKIQPALLAALLADPYFNLAPPKSTGREYFNLPWLEKYLSAQTPYKPEDVQATLVELTAKTLINAILHHHPRAEMLVLCGGGIHNEYMVERLKQLSPSHFQWLSSEAAWGIGPKWIEAAAFAWMAYQTLHHRPSNVPSVTGALRPTILGGIYYP